MPSEQEIARFRAAFEAFASGDREKALADVEPDFVLRDHVTSRARMGPPVPRR